MKLLLAAAALALVPRPLVTSSSGYELRLLAGRHSLEASVSREEVSGESVRLRRGGSSLEGQLWGAPVSLGWRGPRVTGRLGGGAVDLRFQLGGGAVLVEGTLARQSTALLVGPTDIRGRIGGCTYHLELASEAYLGWRTCTGPIQPTPVALLLPRGVELLPEGELVALLAVVLSDARMLRAGR